MNPYAQKFLEILNQSGMIEKTTPRFPFDQQVEIAAFIRVTPGNRPEHTDIPSAVSFGGAEDLLSPLCAQLVQREHVSIVRPMNRRVHPRIGGYDDNILQAILLTTVNNLPANP